MRTREDKKAEEVVEARRRSVLVTGASGYLGRLVMRALADDRQGLKKIVALDVRETPENERRDGVEYVTLDIRSASLGGVIGEHGIDTVVHLATVVTPPKGMTRETQYEIDVTGTANLVEACVAHGVEKLIVTSSGAVYGYHADNPPVLTEDDPLRGNEEFAYAYHKQLVEEMLARHLKEHPSLEQLVFRPGTILGETVTGPISDFFERPIIVGVRGSDTPFVLIWDEDVVACIVAGVHGEQTGIFNLAGDGVMTLREIAVAMGKRFVPLPTWVMAGVLGLLKRLGISERGAEQVDFLRYRPVLSNERLKREFGYEPKLSTREVFELYRRGRR